MDELISLIAQRIEEVYQVNPSAEFSDILWSLGIGDSERIETNQLSDERTRQILDLYNYYQNDPSRAFPNNPPLIWFESVIVLNQINKIRF